jgi:hypothetical protein
MLRFETHKYKILKYTVKLNISKVNQSQIPLEEFSLFFFQKPKRSRCIGPGVWLKW